MPRPLHRVLLGVAAHLLAGCAGPAAPGDDVDGGTPSLDGGAGGSLDAVGATNEAEGRSEAAVPDAEVRDACATGDADTSPLDAEGESPLDAARPEASTADAPAGSGGIGRGKNPKRGLAYA